MAKIALEEQPFSIYLSSSRAYICSSHNFKVTLTTFLGVCYLDDCIFIAPSTSDLKVHVIYAMEMFDSVGLTVVSLPRWWSFWGFLSIQ